MKAIEAPVRQICLNAGIDGAVVIDKILANKSKSNFGYDALKNEYGDMMVKGIIDPTKVTRSALQNASSVAATMLTTESLVSDIPEPEKAQPAMPDGGMGMY